MRKFGTLQLLALGVGTIVGVGWIVAVGGWITQAGTGGAMLAFLIGAIAMAMVAASYGEDGEALSQKGGEVPLVAAAFGETAASVTGFALIIAYLGAIIFEAAALGWLLKEILGPDSAVLVLAIQVAAIALFTTVNARGAMIVGGVQSALTALKIAGFLAMLGCGIAFGASANLSGPERDAAGGPGSVLALAATAPFWYAGFNVIAQTAGERSAAMSTRHVMWTMIASVLIAGVLYVAMIGAVGALVAPSRLGALSMPAADAFAIATGAPWARIGVLLIGMTGILAAWNAMTFATSRIVRAAFAPSAHGNVALQTAMGGFGLGAAAIAGMLGIVAGRAAMDPAITGSAAGLCVVFALVSAAGLRRRMVAGDRGPAVIRLLLSLSVAAAMLLTLLTAAFTAERLPVEWPIIAAAVISLVCIRAVCARLPANLQEESGQ